MIGNEILNYVIESQIGAGGMATVYKARHKTLPDTYRAIKVLHPAMALDAGVRSRFLTEAATMARLDHPNIVKVYDYAEYRDNLYLVMEYIEGFPLDELIKYKTGPIPETRAVGIFSKILDAMAYAHSKGVVHRDIKPSNILITEGDNPKIIDFGIVKILEQEGQNFAATQTGTKLGTPIFMSPEQIVGKGIDRRSDIYSLGVLLFHMITGRVPYEGNLSEYEISNRIMTEPLPRMKTYYPAASDAMQAVVDKATAKAKEDRYDDATAFKTALQASKATPAAGIVKPQQQPVIKSFTADRTHITQGDEITLAWQTNATGDVLIEPLGKTSKTSGISKLRPAESTVYTLKAGGEEQTISVTVLPAQKRGKAGIWVLVLLVLGGLAAAGALIKDSHGRTVFQRLMLSLEESPRKNAEQFLEGIYHLNFDQARAVATEKSRSQINMYERVVNIVANKQTAAADAAKITIATEDPVIDGDKATIDYTISSDNTKHALTMVRQNGKWLADWTKNDMEVNNPAPAAEEKRAAEVPHDATSSDFTDSEKASISGVLSQYYDADNAERSPENVETICNLFAYPVDRYFDSQNVGRDDLYTRILDYSREKLAYHHMDVNLDNVVSESKHSDGSAFSVNVPSEYQYSKTDAPDSIINKEIVNHFVLNQAFKIVAVY